MNRRMLLAAALAAGALPMPRTGFASGSGAAGPGADGSGSDAPAGGPSGVASTAPVTRLAAAWRGLADDSPQRVGVLRIDWSAGRVTEQASALVPSRAHGLLAEPDGFIAVAFRPGDWLWRFDAEGRVAQRVSTADEPGTRRFAGHVAAHPDGRTLLTTEYDARTGEGRIGVRDRRTLRKLDDWASGGLDPHQLLFDDAGRLLVANGGLARTPDGRKRDLDRMDSSLVLLDGHGGAPLGAWRLPDQRLGMRHLAWGPRTADGASPLLGIALQAEHDDPALRGRAPVLATWDGTALALPAGGDEGGGYAGDIAAVDGGFVLSCQPAAIALRWERTRPGALTPVARLREACALAPVAAFEGGVLVAGALGAGRWHPTTPAALLRWPAPMALDNHWVELAAG